MAIAQAMLERAGDKQALLAALEISASNACRLEEFLTSLKAQGYAPYHRAGKLTGIMSEDGRKFRLAALGYDPRELTARFAENECVEKELVSLQELISGQTKDRNVLHPELSLDLPPRA